METWRETERRLRAYSRSALFVLFSKTNNFPKCSLAAHDFVRLNKIGKKPVF